MLIKPYNPPKSRPRGGGWINVDPWLEDTQVGLPDEPKIDVDCVITTDDVKAPFKLNPGPVPSLERQAPKFEWTRRWPASSAASEYSTSSARYPPCKGGGGFSSHRLSQAAEALADSTNLASSGRNSFACNAGHVVGKFRWGGTGWESLTPDGTGTSMASTSYGSRGNSRLQAASPPFSAYSPPPASPSPRPQYPDRAVESSLSLHGCTSIPADATLLPPAHPQPNTVPGCGHRVGIRSPAASYLEIDDVSDFDFLPASNPQFSSLMPESQQRNRSRIQKSPRVPKPMAQRPFKSQNKERRYLPESLGRFLPKANARSVSRMMTHHMHALRRYDKNCPNSLADYPLD